MATNTAPSSAQYLNERGTPDWDALPFEIRCSRCGYNLRLLEQPRCPECGLDFTWPDIIQHQLAHNGVIFEYRWRNRPVRSWFATVWRCLFPTKLWRELSIHDPPRVGPLLVFAISINLGPGGLLWGFGRLAILGLRLWYKLWPSSANQSEQLIQTIYGIMAVSVQLGRFLIHPVVSLFSFGALAGAFFLVLGMRQTLGRCKVLAPQVLRSVIYGFVGAYPLIILLNWAIQYLRRSYYLALLPQVPLDLLFWTDFLLQHLPPLILSSLYLRAALRNYLRLPHAGALAFSAWLVGILFAWTMFFAILLLFGNR